MPPYLHTDDTTPTAAVLAFIYCGGAVTENIKPQYSSHTVPNETDLEISNIKRKKNQKVTVIYRTMQNSWAICISAIIFIRVLF